MCGKERRRRPGRAPVQGEECAQAGMRLAPVQTRETRLYFRGEGWSSQGRQGPLTAKEGHFRRSQAGEHAVGAGGAEHDLPVAGGCYLLHGHQLPDHGPGKWTWQMATFLACGVFFCTTSLSIFSILEDINTTSSSFFADVQTKHGLSKVSSWENRSTPH